MTVRKINVHFLPTKWTFLLSIKKNFFHLSLFATISGLHVSQKIRVNICNRHTSSHSFSFSCKQTDTPMTMLSFVVCCCCFSSVQFIEQNKCVHLCHASQTRSLSLYSRTGTFFLGTKLVTSSHLTGRCDQQSKTATSKRKWLAWPDSSHHR